MSWATLPVAAALGRRLAAGDSSWQGSNLTLSTYWDCNGQGCDAPTLQPWNAALYVSSPGYGPQDPNDFGGPVYGEAMWLTGAASDTLSALLGPDDGCCGEDGNDGGVGGCGRCLLVQNEESLHPEWTAVVMKKSRCPPGSAGCGAGAPHFDIAVPGFDYLSDSMNNVCGQPGTGFASQEQSVPFGSWWDLCTSWPCDLGQFEPLCDELPSIFQPGCRLFTSWGWRAGNPSAVKYQAVECPSEFVKHVQSAFGPDGPQGEPARTPTPAPSSAPVNSTTCASGAWDGCHESRCCADEDFTCFAKDAHWAQCLRECAPGEIRPADPPAFQTPWSCAVHGQGGSPAPTAAPTVAPSQTPSAPTAAPTVAPGQTPSAPTVAPTLAPSQTPCSSGAWDSCRASRCCADEGFTCFQKDQYWAQCLRDCAPGEVRPDDPPEFQSPWTCVVLDISVTETSHSSTASTTSLPATSTVSQISVSGSYTMSDALTHTRSTTSQFVTNTASVTTPQTESTTTLSATSSASLVTALAWSSTTGPPTGSTTQEQSTPGVSATSTQSETSQTATGTMPPATGHSSLSETSTLSPETTGTTRAIAISPTQSTATTTGTTSGTTTGTTIGTTSAFGQFTTAGTTSESVTQAQSAPDVSATSTQSETSSTVTGTVLQVTGHSSLSETSTFSPGMTSTTRSIDNSPTQSLSSASATAVAGTAPISTPQTTSYLRGSSTTIDTSSAGPSSTRTTSTTWSSVATTSGRPASAACTPGEYTDCSQSRCCTEPGLQCFEKHEWYAQCRRDCSGKASWSCRVLQP